VLGTVGWALDADTGREFAVGHNPYAVESLPTGPMFAVGFAIVGAALLAAALSLAVRLYRAKGIERLQLKWFVFAAGAAAVVPSVVFFFWYTVPALRPLTALALTAVPVAACIAILRYRLYDIDLIISRTLIYGVLTVMLGGSYVATTLLLGVAVGQGSSLATAGATLVVAIAFRPLRDRVQGRVDRSFSRARYDAMRRMRAFLDDLRVGRAAPEDVEMAMREALSDPTLELRFFLPESGVEVDSRGRPVSGGSDAGRLRTPLTRGGVCLGEIVHAPRTEAQRVLVAPVVEAAELPVEIARLRVELRRQLDEVKDSRRRIVQAAEHERHRLERDLHDGAQQRLVSIGLALRHAQHALGPDPPHDAITTLDGALAEIAVAIEELRELARGIRPSCLDEGLGPALRELAGKARLPVEVRANGERFAPDLETAAYFIACEGLTNAVKHARATHVTLAVDRIDDTLVVSVSDDGVGARTLRTGTGLTGLSDRVAAHGGSLRIETSEGDGTILVAALPCAS
jgi:signal transduction histidine kinase